MALALDPVLAGRVLAPLYRAWCATLRYRVEGWDKVMDHIRSGGLCVFSLWHDELFALTYWGIRERISGVTVVSQSKDGEFLAQPLERLGLRTARGSTTRGGLAALRQARRYMLEEGRQGVITVDGPRGPRHEAKEGAVYLAKRAGALILPLRIELSKAFVFHKSWDRFQVPCPFSRVTIRFGTPYPPPQGKLTADVLAAEKRKLEECLALLGRD